MMTTRLSVRIFMVFAYSVFTLLVSHARESADEQFKRADLVAWCEVTRIELLEAPRIEVGMSSQMRRFTFRMVEPIKGALPEELSFSLQFAEYEVLDPSDLEAAATDVLVEEIHGRPRIEVGKLYRLYFQKVGKALVPISGRWSILEMKVDPNVAKKWKAASNSEKPNSPDAQAAPEPPAARPESKPEEEDKPQPHPEGRSR